MQWLSADGKSDLDPNPLTLYNCSERILKKIILKKSQQMTTKNEKLPSMQKINDHINDIKMLICLCLKILSFSECGVFGQMGRRGLLYLYAVTSCVVLALLSFVPAY